MEGIIIVGSLNLDMVVSSPFIPSPGENICGDGFRMVPGGKGANQAVAAGRLGSSVYMLGCVGADYFGEFLTTNLEAAGVDPSMVKHAEGVATGVALIVVEKDTGINTIVVDPGANMALEPGDLDPLERHFGDAHSIMFQLEIPLDVVAEGARRARERGLMTILDAGPPRSTEIEVLRLFDVVSPNQNELTALTGADAGDPTSARNAAAKLVRDGVPTVVVKMADQGALLANREGAWHFPPYSVRAVDATAAGDAFTAGLATALGEGRDIHSAVRFANAAGAVAVTVMGAQPSMPGRGQVEELMLLGEAGGVEL